MTSENLLNLEKVGQLDAVEFSQDLLDRMLTTARSRLQDALRKENSAETRCDCAYTAIRPVADAALLKQGYRTSTSKPPLNDPAVFGPQAKCSDANRAHPGRLNPT